MLNRNELLHSLTMLMVDQGYALSDAQAKLVNLSTSELELHFARALNAGTLNADGTLKKPVPPTPSVSWEDVAREKARLQEESDELRIRLQAENAADLTLAAYKRWEAKEPERNAQLARDRQTFIDASNTLRSFAVVEANFHLIRSTLGENFSVYSIQQGLLSNALILVPPTQQQIDDWAEQDEEARRQRLMNASPSELKQAVRSESEARRAATAEEQAARELESAKSRCEYAGYKPLPPEIDGAAIKRATGETLKKWIRLYGDFQLTSRIRGLA